MTLEDSLSNREMIINGLKSEFIGPEIINENYHKLNLKEKIVFDNESDTYNPFYWENNGLKEEIIKEGSPSQRYVSGILQPYLKEFSQEELDREKLSYEAEMKRNSVTDIEDNDESKDGEYADDLPNYREYSPSSLGLTYCVSENVNNLKVNFKGGIYKKYRIYIDGNGYKEWWFRETVSAEENVDLNSLKKDKKTVKILELKSNDKKISDIELKLNMFIRKIKDVYIITTSVTNYSERKTEESNVFQSEIQVKTGKGEYFSPYPQKIDQNLSLTEDDLSNALLYKDYKEYGFGHGCSVFWETNKNDVDTIATTFLPEYEMLSMTPDILIENDVGEKIPLKIKMADLAGLTNIGDLKVLLQPLIKGYNQWIEDRYNEIKGLRPDLQKIAKKHIDSCSDTLKRMKRGYELLEDEHIEKSFRLANNAILLQQLNGKNKRNSYIDNDKLHFSPLYDESIKLQRDLPYEENSWRAFQIAFLLMSIESIVDESSEDREIVDLIWFPTGGGKTEAYLGVAAFQMFYRRILNPRDAGVNIIMRYTLRLLTADQFTRSARLMVSMDYIRRKNIDLLGETPFSIGIWAGAKNSPNNVKEADKNLKNLMNNKKEGQEFLVRHCPWCGAKIGYYESKGKRNSKSYHGYSTETNNLLVHCPDKECEFHDHLPIFIVDEDIYKYRPTFLLGTIDKFVQVVWKPEARGIFGLNFETNREAIPPSLIIQDELHLISGPLGSLSGIFEILIEELCLQNENQDIIKPKIIAATATIKNYQDQIKGLFGRKRAQIFPSPGLNVNDSFFSQPAKYKESNEFMPGRKYIGIYPQKVKGMMSQVMVFSRIAQTTKQLPIESIDPYWSILSFYNTLKELSQSLTLIQTDIPNYSRGIRRRKGFTKVRELNNPITLTSKEQSHEISQAIGKLNQRITKNSKSTVDICLASSIIEVGVDIDRLSLMTIIGQPNLTSQYIQVSGRIGRKWDERPGLVITLYNNKRSRDKSHYEHFIDYHQKMYAHVEATSVTPFSEAAVRKGLQAIIVGYFRQKFDRELATRPDSKKIKNLSNEIKEFRNRILERVRLVDEEQENFVDMEIKNILNDITSKNYPSWEASDDSGGYMYRAGSYQHASVKNKAVSMMNTMRNVDSESKAMIMDIYEEPKDSFNWSDFLT